MRQGDSDVTDETQWLASLKRRDPEALAEVFQQYASRIYRLAAGILHDEQQADGVVQNTFLALIEQIDHFEGRSSIGTWLYRVAYHECLGRLRKAKPQVPLDDIHEDEAFMPAHLVDWQTIPDRVMSSHETADEIKRAIERLPETLRTVFVLRDVEELSTRATAEILGISEPAVKVRLHRARLALREALAKYFEEYARS